MVFCVIQRAWNEWLINFLKFPLLFSVLNPDNSFEILVDQSLVNSGNLLNDMTPPVNPSREIEDPDDRKPEDWDERPKIPDPDAVKPDDW